MTEPDTAPAPSAAPPPHPMPPPPSATPSTTSSPSSSTPTDNTADDAAVDLTPLLSCLSREDLELLLAQAIERLPSLYPKLLSLVNKPVDTVTLSSSLGALLSFSSLPSTLTPDLETHVDQAANYIAVGLVSSGLTVLDALTSAFVDWVKQHRRGKEEEVDDEYRNLESFFGLLESTWSDAFAAVLISDATVSDPEPRRPPVVKGANRLTLHELSAYATKLGQWQSSLTKSMGPLFSDPLRSLKRKIRLASHAPPATKEDEGVSSKRIKR